MCNWTDNLIKIFTLNKFCTRNLQSIWYAVYLSLLFSKLLDVNKKQISVVVCLAFLVFFRFFFSQLTFRLLHLYYNSHMCLAVLVLEIIPKTIWNCSIAFFDALIRKYATHEMCTNGYRSWGLEKNWIVLFNWMYSKSMSEWLLSYSKC